MQYLNYTYRRKHNRLAISINPPNPQLNLCFMAIMIKAENRLKKLDSYVQLDTLLYVQLVIVMYKKHSTMIKNINILSNTNLIKICLGHLHDAHYSNRDRILAKSIRIHTFFQANSLQIFIVFPYEYIINPIMGYLSEQHLKPGYPF
jgi:hypothetical protein